MGLRRHAKASSAGSISGTDSSRVRTDRAFATRGVSSDAKGSGAPAGGLLLTTAIACLMVLAFASAAQAGVVPGFGVLGTGTTGAGTGQIGGSGGPKGLATNTSGAGGVPSGSVYVSDFANNRVSQFTGAGAHIRTWGWDVVASGEHNTGANEQQNVTVKATGGNFTLTVTTASAGSGIVTSGSNQVTNVQASLGSFNVGDTITGSGIPTATTITGISGSSLTLSKTATGSFVAVNLLATETTANIPATATAAEVEAALEAKAGVGDITVAGGPGNATGTTPYQVTFTGGPLSHDDIAQMTATSVALSGGSPSSSVTVATATAGGGYEVCQAASTPADVCKAGIAGAGAGNLAGAQGLAVDPATGNVFVVSDTNKRVDVFSSTGQFYGAFGWSVNNTTPESKLQFCTTVTGCKAGSAGAGAGQLGTMTGIAQQGASPAVSPLNGHLLVPEPGNRRVSEFSFTLSGSEVTGVSFVKAFGGDVVPTVFEKQTVTLSGATGGTFALSFGGKSTEVTGKGDSEAGSNEISNLKADAGAFVAGEEVFGPGIPGGTRITAVTFDSLTLSNAVSAAATGATFTAALPFNATAVTVQGALAGLSSIGNGNVAVTGANGGPYTVEFTGKFSGEDVAQMSADGSKLTGSTPSVAVATVQPGANGGGEGFETCTVATTCKEGISNFLATFPGSFGTSVPASIAVDSTGSIYVTGHSGFCGEQAPGLSCGVQKFNSSATTVELFAPAQLAAPAQSTGQPITARLVAVDPANDHVLVVKKVSESSFKVFEFTRTGSFIDASPAGETGVASAATGSNGPQGFAVGTANRAYYAISTGGGNAPAVPPARILGNPPAPKATVETPSGITQTKATLTGVAQPSAPGIEGGFATAAWFEYSSNGVSWTATDPKEIGTGTGAGNPNSCPTANPPSCNVSQVVGGLKGGTTYLVRLVVSNGTKTTSTTATFSTTDSAPGIKGLGANEVTQTAAFLNGEIEPNGKITSYHFEWGPTTAYGTRVPADLEAIAGGGNDPIPVSIQISGLQEGATYHYRIVAKSSSGTTTSADQELTTLNSWGLPSRRGVELVSPANKRPVGDVRQFIFGQVRFQAAEDGDGITFPILNGLEDSTGGGELSYAGRRTESGWLSKQVSSPGLIPKPEPEIVNGARTSNVRAYNSNLQCAAVESHNPLSADTPPVDVENGVSNLYLWNASDGSYTLITKTPPQNPTSTGQLTSHYRVAGISSDCSKVYFRPFTYVFIPGSSGLYEWDNGTLRDAGLRPDGSVPPRYEEGAFSEEPGVASVMDRYTVSKDERFFFAAASNEPGENGKLAIFARKGPGDVINVSKPTNGPTQGALYQAASPNGSHVFFLANYGIAATSSSGPTSDNCATIAGLSGPRTITGTVACDLYVYDLKDNTLTDVSADTNPADPRGAVVQGVLDVSGDGEVVYFAARGQLVPGEGRTYVQNLLGAGSANVYRYEDGELAWVGVLTTSDMEGGRGAGGGQVGAGALVRNQENWGSQTTKDGEYLLFTSSYDLTGDNPNGLPQAYLYSATAGSTECVSCPKVGAAQQAGLVTTQVGALTQTGTGGTYTPRTLSEDGRVFFLSRDRLAPGAVQGRPGGLGEDGIYVGYMGINNLYEWHRGQLSLVTSGELLLMDTGGDDGKDVYVLSYEQHAPQDIDFAADVYDFRIGGGFAAPPVITPCDPAAEECQGTPTTPPSAPSTPSSDFNGPGNPAPEKPKPPKCGKGKVLKHGKCVKKPKKKKQKGQAQSKKTRAASTNRGGAK